MRFSENASLQTRNTFAIAAKARFLAEVYDEHQLAALLKTVTAKRLKLLILGGGSNMLLSQDFDGLVICPQLLGIRCLSEDAESVIIEASAGENWHQFVQYCVAQGWYGLENLSLIAGSVGAAPVQNIGAYGVELKDNFVSFRVKGFLFTRLNLDVLIASLRLSLRDQISGRRSTEHLIVIK